MKRIVSLLLLVVLCALPLFSCGKKEATPVVTRVGYFPGTTGIGMSKMIADADPDYTFTKFENPSEILAKLVTGEIDIAAYPTNGVPALNQKVEGGVQYLAVNTLGVLYLCTNGVTIEKLADLEGQTVYIPEKAPQLVLDYILKSNGITVTFAQSSLDMLPTQIATGEGDVRIALLPEPKVTVAKNTAVSKGSDTFAISPIDLNAEWNLVSDTPLVQGCLVVRTDFARNYADEVNAFLTAYQASINFVRDSAQLESVAQMVVDAGVLPKLPIAKQAIPRSNITYMEGDEMKNAVLGFLKAFGASYPDDGFYLPVR